MKKLYFVTGDKGGVGKTFTTRVLDSYLDAQNKTYISFDTDKANSTFKRYSINNANLIDLDEKGALDEAFEDVLLNSDTEYLLVDCAARTLDSIIKWMMEVDFNSIAKELELVTSFFFVLGQDKDSLQILNDIIKTKNEKQLNFNLILVKNHGRNTDFSLFETSKLPQLVESLGIKTIEINELLPKAVKNLDRFNLSFSASISSEELGLFDKKRVESFLDTSFKNISDSGVI